MEEASTERPKGEKEVMEDFIRQFMASVAALSKSSKLLPSGTDYAYFQSTKEFATSTKEASFSTADLISKVIRFAGCEAPVAFPPDLSEAVVYDYVADAIDVLLEKSFTFIQANERNEIRDSIKSTLLLDRQRLLNKDEVSDKPQEYFLDDIDNDRMRPFKPKLDIKYHSIVPLDLTPKAISMTSESGALLGGQRDEGEVFGPTVYYPHPYEKELLSFRVESNPSRLARPSSIVAPSQDAPLLYVDDVESLSVAIDELSASAEIAVDLEHHSYRSFLGLTCLMQISTRTKDYLIDTLKLRKELRKMGVVFANPAITKVFHGCESDIKWLQRDLGLYVVNCFDTFHAAKLLQYPSLSLAHLVKLHCGVTLNKKYQLADWRIRELPHEMQDYAKKDTHYLLQVFDALRQELYDHDPEAAIKAVYDLSKRTCLIRYEKPLFWPLGYRKLLSDKFANGRTAAITETQDLVLAALYEWRDHEARLRDESIDYIMSNSELLRIGFALPVTESDLQKCGPLCTFVSSNAKHVVEVVNNSLQSNPVNVSRLSIAPQTPVRGSKSSSRILATPVPPELKSVSTTVINNIELYPSIPTSHTFIPGGEVSRSTDSIRSDGSLSPVLDASAIFRLAGWTTPIHGVSSTLSLFDFVRKKRKSSLSQEEENEFTLKLRGDIKSMAGLEFPSLDTNGIPSTSEEIYAISNENKLKERENKRPQIAKADNDDEADSFVTALLQDGHNFQVDAPTDKFMESLGWGSGGAPEAAAEETSVSSNLRLSSSYELPAGSLHNHKAHGKDQRAPKASAATSSSSSLPNAREFDYTKLNTTGLNIADNLKLGQQNKSGAAHNPYLQRNNAKTGANKRYATFN